MTGDDFAKLVYQEKESLKKNYFAEDSQALAAEKIRGLVAEGASEEQLKELVDLILTDAYYGLLLGLDGSASIGDTQQEYKIYDEEGTLLNECGEIEEGAYKYFYEDGNE